ncbi:MAG: TldD/PmbA family protein [Alphaproteobacteria bacterium]|nr:TldD/PmbA family protein [Alphaproteobacteria bacterium]
MFRDRDDALALVRRVLAMSQADGCRVLVGGGDGCNIRLASRGGMSNGAGGGAWVTINSSYGRRAGSASTNATDETALHDAVARSDSAARLAPENPEEMPPLGPQNYPASAAYSEATARLTATDLADLLAPAVEPVRRAGADFALYAYAERGWRAYGTNAGALGYDRMTRMALTVTARNRRGTWSGWGGSNANDVAKFDAAEITRAALDKALAQPDPVAIDPGKYATLLEPAVVGQMVTQMMGRFDARAADEGRSFLSRSGGTRLGEQAFDPRVTITSDPANPDAPGYAVHPSGLPNHPVTWIDGGTIKTFGRGRYWAQKTGTEAVATPGFFAMRGGSDSTAAMIRDVKRGVLVTRMWYVRLVDPRTLVVTGLTRDGTFLIENGAVTRPIANFRFNESPLSMLANVLAIGPAQRAIPSENDDTLSMPPLLVKDFTFSSISPAV